ncbi:MAG TPA: HD domain-containing phosphohydrolase [Deltaproteobacteria bacterium]|nr:HD domain-containing phosphohydrolase [Deltaproteobacteria bacterium]
MGLPIYKDTKVVGCLELFRKGSEAFTFEDLILTKHLLLSSERVIREVLSSEREYDEVLDVTLDVPQRHVLHQYEELARRMGFPLAVALIEIDDPERFGLYQHIPEGIRTIKNLAKRIQEGLRCYDKVLRYEELSFFVILPGCSPTEAVTALHKASLRLGADLADTMTIAVATMPDDAQDAKGIIHVAHQVLSHARKKGLHIATYAQTEMVRHVNSSLELRLKRILHAGPCSTALDELLDLVKIQCQADDVCLRYEPPGKLITWEGNELGYIQHAGLSQEICDWVATCIAPAWAFVLGMNTDVSDWYYGVLSTASLLSDLRAGCPMGYSLKISDEVYALAREMGVGDVIASQWATSSLVANIGYLGIPTTLFTKGELTPFDRKKITMHPVITTRILKDVAVLDLDGDLLSSHHENFDGTGYPRGLRGEDIPLSARAMRVVDSFNAMVTPRLHRPKIPFKEALRELCTMSGKSLDPEIVSLYVDVIGS